MRFTAALPLAFAAACAVPPAGPPAPSAPPAATTASAPSALPTATIAPEQAASAAPAAPPPPGIQPLDEAEQKETQRTCQPILNAMQARKKKKARSGGADPLQLLEQVVLEPPPAMSKPALARCTELLRRGLATYLQAAIETEARVTTRQIGRSMAASYEREEVGKAGAAAHALCPSAPPVPADLGAVRGKPYVSQESDWSAAGWACLRFQLSGNQRFQYEVQTDPGGKSFVVIARTASPDGSRVIELRQPGAVDARGEVQLQDPQRTERAP